MYSFKSFQALFHCLSYLQHCPRPKSGRRVAKKLIHRQKDPLPPSNLPFLDSDHDTAGIVGKLSRRLTQRKKKTADSDIGRAFWHRLKFRCIVTFLHTPPRARTSSLPRVTPPRCHVSPRHVSIIPRQP